MVAQLGGLPMDASAANAQQAVTVNKPARLLKQSDGKGGAVRDLDVGMMLYPTGNKDGLMWEVDDELRSEEHTSELQSLMRISYAVFCLKKKKQTTSK